MRSQFKNFAKCEDGSIINFTLIVFVVFLAAAGMGADFMRYELYRADLQSSLDRGVLAATAFSQTQDPSDVITEFVEDSEKWRGLGTLPSVNVSRFPNDQTWFDGPVNERRISANASTEVPMQFLRFVGIGSLPLNVGANASQTRNPVEVVMVLDISASMDNDDASTNDPRIEGLRRSAKLFIDKVLTPETVELTSVTLVPFGGSVNPGDFLPYLTNVNVGELPTWATDGTAPFPVCPHFDLAEMSGTNIDDINYNKPYETHRTFKRYGAFPGQTNDIRWSWCPEPDAGIVAMSNNATALKNRIDSMGLYDGTGIDVALKWGIHALSPDARNAVTGMIGSGQVSNNFAGWPNSFTDINAEKYIVFLTDGGITDQYDLPDDLWNGTTTDLASRDIFDSDDDRDDIVAHIESIVGSGGRLADFWSWPSQNFFNTPPSTAELHSNIMRGTGDVRVNNNNNSKGDSFMIGSQVTRWNKNQALQHVENLCNFTKQTRADGRPYARVFTIGFDLSGIDFATYVPPTTASAASSKNDRITFVLNHCASSPGDRYLATSATLDTAFDQIVSVINSLRLTN